MRKLDSVISQWCQLIENFQFSSSAFYDAVEKAVVARAIPEVHGARIEHKEGGLASASRVYVRVHRGKHAFDICAAPFGTGFFVSWWFTEPPLRFGFLYTLAFFTGVGIAMNVVGGFGFTIGVAISGWTFGALLALCFAGLGVPVLLWIVGNALRHGTIRGESTVLAVPLIGWIYERIFAPPTYYAIDTALMFQEAVRKAVLEVIDCITAEKGVRALTEDERKPVLKKFGASA
jgi:hypothetical protein